jgi:hypothetical protein
MAPPNVQGAVKSLEQSIYCEAKNGFAGRENGNISSQAGV